MEICWTGWAKGNCCKGLVSMRGSIRINCICIGGVGSLMGVVSFGVFGGMGSLRIVLMSLCDLCCFLSPQIYIDRAHYFHITFDNHFNILIPISIFPLVNILLILFIFVTILFLIMTHIYPFKIMIPLSIV